MINYLSKFNYLSIKLITCRNKLIADQKMIDDYTKTVHLQLLVRVYSTLYMQNVHTRGICSVENGVTRQPKHTQRHTAVCLDHHVSA